MAKTDDKALSAAKEEFEKTLASSSYNEKAKNLGTVIFKKITSLSDNNALAEIHAKIAAAATQGDDALLEKLFAQLSQAKLDQKNIADQYKGIRGNNSFQTILQAYSEEFRALAHMIADEVVKGSNAALKGSKTRASSGTSTPSESKPVVSYNVENPKGESAVVVMRSGRAGADLTQDKEFFEILGFKIEKDESGKERLNPTHFKLSSGKEVEAKRSAIVKAIKEKTAFEGFTARQI